MKSLRNPSWRPTHPGAVLREDIVPALKMTQTELAERIGDLWTVRQAEKLASIKPLTKSRLKLVA
jgi:hypothetical protein